MKRICLVFAVVVAVGLSLLFAGQIFSQTSKVLARVGDRVITEQEMKDMMSEYIKYKPKKGDPLTVEEKKQLLDRMVDGALLALEAEKEKIDETPEFKEKLQSYRNQLLINQYVEKEIIPSVKVTDEEVEKILQENLHQIPQESLILKEIIVKTEKEAQDIYDELKKGGDFAKIVHTKSISPTADQGGQMKMPVSRGMFAKEMEDGVFALKKDEFTKPIKTDKGYWAIFSLVDKKVRTDEEMDRIKNQIREKVRATEKARKTSEDVNKRIEELKKNYKVEAYYNEIQ